jgi:hypothetical protein
MKTKTTKSCLQCGQEHTRKKFCSNKCKDRYHNTRNPDRMYRALTYNRTMHPDDAERFVQDFDPDDPMNEVHPFSSFALGQD